MEITISEKTEKLIKIILPNYLGMVESGEIIKKRIERNCSLIQKDKDDDIHKKKSSKNSLSK